MRTKTRWETVIEIENAKEKIDPLFSLKELLIEYNNEWKTIPWYMRLLESKKRLGERLFLAGSVAGMTQLLKVAEAREKEKK